MKVILLQDVKGQGKKDDVIEVSAGYAQNFLFPRKLATIADSKAVSELRGREESKQFKIDEERKAAKALAERLAGITVKIKAASGADGRLYGAVTAKDIAEALEKEFSISIDKRKMSLSDPIKAYGTYQIDLKLFTDIMGKITVVVCD